MVPPARRWCAPRGFQNDLSRSTGPRGASPRRRCGKHRGVTAIAAERPRERRTFRLREASWRVLLFFLVLAALWGFWEGYRWLWMREHWTWPFRVDDTAMPHIHAILAQLFEPSRLNGPLLIHVLFDSALFTSREAAVGFAI